MSLLKKLIKAGLTNLHDKNKIWLIRTENTRCCNICKYYNSITCADKYKHMCIYFIRRSFKYRYIPKDAFKEK